MSNLFVQMFAFNSAIAKEQTEKLALMARNGRNAAFKPSPYQQAIFDFIAAGHGSAMVKAVAGSGKSTTCRESLWHVPGLDFQNVKSSTFHSAGFGAVVKKLGLPYRSVNVDGRKMLKLLRDRLSESDFGLYGTFAAKLVGYAKGEGLGAIASNHESQWFDLISHHNMSLDSTEAKEESAVAIAQKGLQWSNEAAEKGILDFDDQLYLPLLWRLKLWENDYVYVDEAQDTNPVRRAVCKLALKPGGRLIAVGDPMQSIYGFTGASCDAMELIQKEFNCVELPLTVSYRCSKAVVAKAKTIVPYIEPAESAPEGSVQELELKDALKLLGQRDAILCRNTAPLIELAFNLIAQGIGCTVLGREIGQQLVTMIEKQKAKNIDALREKLDAFQTREVARFMAKGEEQRADALCDRIACINAVIGHLTENDRTVPALIRKLDSMFSDESGTLTLSTMHKSKGREWNRVAILRPDLCPSKWARQDWQQAQETNLLYVAWTRAMTDLIILDGE